MELGKRVGDVCTLCIILSITAASSFVLKGTSSCRGGVTGDNCNGETFNSSNFASKACKRREQPNVRVLCSCIGGFGSHSSPHELTARPDTTPSRVPSGEVSVSQDGWQRALAINEHRSATARKVLRSEMPDVPTFNCFFSFRPTPFFPFDFVVGGISSSAAAFIRNSAFLHDRAPLCTMAPGSAGLIGLTGAA